MLLTYGFYACRHLEVSQEVSRYCLAGWTQHGSKVNEIIIWTIQVLSSQTSVFLSVFQS